ncbi:winged helix DNA-binding protein [Nocardia vaccinii]|uniref:winged helix DNA-binding protein n=1 Tax=Nocardia vaccinii TaxID=1822 RepID=UPI00082C9F09|nr:winged helix DNA-binding protein [Nocardia vaccinii]
MNVAELHRLVRVLREIASSATVCSGDQQMSAGMVAIVQDVTAHPDSAIGDIAERTGLAQSFVSKTVVRLREGGVFEVSQDPRDGRRTLVAVRSGSVARKQVPDTSVPIEEGLRAVFPDLTDAQMNRIMLGLSVLADEILGDRTPEPQVSVRRPRN